MIQRLTLTVLLAALLPACQEGPPVMLGEHNVLVVAPPTLWAEVEDSLRAGLEVRPTALPAENPFDLTHASPTAVGDRELRTYRQIVVVGRVGDPLVDETLPRDGAAASAPTLAQSPHVWRDGQEVVVLALREGDGPGAVLDHVAELSGILHEQYRGWTRRRMYSMGIEAGLADSLAAVGVELAVPDVYRWRRLSDTTFVFETPSNDLARRLRSVLLTWRSTIDGEMPVSAVLDWRQEMADMAYEGGHTTRRDPLEIRPLEGSGHEGIEVRGGWGATIDGQPQGGPFITRSVHCPGQARRYLLDAWVFAPRSSKYRYLIQLETILDTFDCPERTATAPSPGTP